MRPVSNKCIVPRFDAIMATVFLSTCILLLNSCKDEETLPPTIISFSPISGSVGTVVSITGTNFNPTLANNILKFNGTLAIVTVVTPVSLTVAVPVGASTGKISITVEGITTNSEADFTVFDSPEITNISPAYGLPGASVTITGKNFSSILSGNTVKFNTLAATLTAATSTSLTVTIPPGATTGKISITVHDLTATSSDDFVIPPTITSFSPSSGIIGSSLTIIGTGFNATIANNIVKLNNKLASVTSATTTSLTVTVPAEALTDKISIIVSGQTVTSSIDFIIVPTISGFLPSIGAIGSTVTITGTGFSGLAVNNIVKFNGISAIVTMSSPTSLVVIVPVGATMGNITVGVGANTVASTAAYEIVIEAVKSGGLDFDQGTSITVDGTGNAFITGRFTGTTTFGNSSLTSNGSDDIFLAKYNSACDLIWVKQIGGAGTDNCLSITIDPSGNIYTTGTFMGTISFGTTTLASNGGSGDIFVAKFNASGEAVWAKKIGSASGNVETGYSVKVDASGNLYLTGSFLGTVAVGTTNLTSSGSSDVLVAKYNSTSGEVIWAKNFGGSDDDSGLAITYNATGDIYVSGAFFGAITFSTINLISAGGLDGFITKLNSSGEVVWAKQIAGPIWESASALAVDLNGNCYVSGYFTQTATLGTNSIVSAGNEDVYLAKYSSNGEVLWVKRVGGSDYDNAYSVAVDATGNAYVTGYFTRTVTFGDKSLSSNNNSRDIFITKFNSAGEIVWVNQAGGTDNDYGQSVIVDTSGTVYITGTFRETVTFGSTTMSSRGNDDVYLWKIRQ